MESICSQCGISFKKKSGTRGIFCSYLCYWKSLIGKEPWNKNTKGVMKAWNKGKKTGYVPKTAWKKGDHISKKTEFKKGQFAKEKHPMWNGGTTLECITIRQSVEGRLWREAVFARDNYTCQKTGIKGGELVAHHILNFSSNPDLRFAIDNGISLSANSHDDFHKKYGKRNNTKEQLLEFLNKKNGD